MPYYRTACVDTRPTARSASRDSLGERVEAVRVPAPPPPIEIRRRGPHGDESDVDIHAVACPDDVTEEPSVVVHAIGRGFSGESHPSSHRQEALRRCGRLRPVALGAEVDLGRRRFTPWWLEPRPPATASAATIPREIIAALSGKPLTPTDITCCDGNAGQAPPAPRRRSWSTARYGLWLRGLS